ncbi:MarR family transcriptional regulator [Microbacterium mangrovi]|uniref:MarR family transcriptional regulator n=1 Tax=Microbacterium mangrovi TaxID=1348253 RepID=A0A0B2AC00_9MICO|nr:MarR family transcriptional regulator [Microbacterium mangrovi]KHK99161.1 MarR family transcriptional regulator [Microbacterium mangrovi]
MAGRRSSTRDEYRRAVETYVAAGGDESVQRVITAAQSLNRKLDQWYARQLVDLDLTAGEWGVIAGIARAGEPLTPGYLAELTSVAPSSMTHRLDRLAERGLVERTPDAENRTRVLVGLTDAGWRTFSSVIRSSNVVESDVLQDLSDRERDELARLLEIVILRLDHIGD